MGAWRVHQMKIHPTPPPPKPKVQEYEGVLFGKRLIDPSRQVKLGDRLVFKQVVIVRKLTTIEGDKVVSVDCDKISDSYEKCE